jgi:hypothetical protein
LFIGNFNAVITADFNRRRTNSIRREKNGWDTIEDSDGSGEIIYDGLALAGGEHVGGNMWKDADRNIVYTLNGNTLAIVFVDGGGRAAVRNWQEDKNLGIATTVARQLSPVLF